MTGNDQGGQRDRAGWTGDHGGQLGELVQAIKAGVTYANVHTSQWPGGEIRAQLDNDKSDDN